MTISTIRLEEEIQILGSEIFHDLKRQRPSLLDAQRYTELFLSLGMQDEALKVSLFRFVDVLPTLPDAASVIRHVQEYFGPVRDRIPEPFRLALSLSPTSLTARPAAATIRKMVGFVASQFIVGSDGASALKALRKIRKNGQAFTVDILGEATVNDSESLAYLNRYLELVQTLSAEVPKWPEAAPIVRNHRGEHTPVNVSVKLSALYAQARPLNAARSQRILQERLGQIFAAAKARGVFVYVDMEDCSLTTLTLDTVKALLGSAEFRDYDRCGFVLQAYLRRTQHDIEELIPWVRERGTPVGVRLVKGAYWDTETILAKQQEWPIPVWQRKQNSDANYELLSLLLLKNSSLFFPAFASHNIRSLVHAVKAADLLGVPATEYELQTLYGMADPIKRAFSERGYLVREYAPVGELLPGMGYLVRRLLENVSNEGFLRQSFHEHASPELLLRKPQLNPEDTGKEHLGTEHPGVFRNCPLTDFSLPEERAKLADALTAVSTELAREPEAVRPIFGGLVQRCEQSMPSVSPERPAMKLATIELASAAQAQSAIEHLSRVFPRWRATPVEERCRVLNRTAELLEERRPELTAIIVLEAGKPWAEADGDVAEAVDFLRYYAAEARSLFHPRQLGDAPGEVNRYFYEPRGVAAVISPWNFPLAIPCGMFAAAVVTGNCAILKPAEQTSLIAKRLFEAFLDAGLPADCAAFLPGIGETVGPVLSAHPAVTTIAFTGSRTVGMLLLREAALASAGAIHVKRVIAEMGGKNAIIVDDDADYDEAVKGILSSAFGFAGQKCSACSRAIIVGEGYNRFVQRLTEAAQSIILGPASDSSSFLGPVIDQEAFERISGVIAAASKDASVLVNQGTRSEQCAPDGYYISPAIIADLPTGHRVLTDEIFGPVLALIRAKDFAEALDIANGSEYALTGAVFSRSPKNITRAAEEFRVGNLYINRGSTGALVGRQPFGGAKMSGVGSKAGGPDYLLQFVIPRVVTENTLRRGFAPMEPSSVEGL